jgi:hypothetical protein
VELWFVCVGQETKLVGREVDEKIVKANRISCSRALYVSLYNFSDSQLYGR